MIDLVIRALKGALYFSFCGPLFGYLTVMLFAFVRRPSWEFVDPSLIAIAVFAYFIGAVPAATTGLLAGVLSPWLLGWRHYLMVGMVGGIFACAFALLVSLGSPTWDLFGNMFVPGLVGGTLSAWLLCLPPNNSSKPTPLRGTA